MKGMEHEIVKSGDKSSTRDDKAYVEKGVTADLGVLENGGQ